MVSKCGVLDEARGAHANVKDRIFGLTYIYFPSCEGLQDFGPWTPYSIRIWVSPVEQKAPASFYKTFFFAF
jgi:hypothetical protein